ncbi:hypothetical protein COOONC_12857 [Cooperia oncophora]
MSMIEQLKNELSTRKENLSTSIPASAKAASRNRTKKRLPLSDNTKSQAAKRNRLSGAASQIQTYSRQDAANNADRKRETENQPSSQLEKPTRKKRRTKKQIENDPGSENGRRSEEPQMLSPKEANSRRTKMQKVINEVITNVFFVFRHYGGHT